MAAARDESTRQERSVHPLASSAVAQQAEKGPQSEAYREWRAGKGLRSIAYRTLERAVNLGARSLTESSLGVARGDCVGILSAASFEFYVAVLSLERIGATPAILPWKQSVYCLIDLLCRADESMAIVLVARAFVSMATRIVAESSNAPRLALILADDKKLPPLSSRAVGFEIWTCSQVSNEELATPKRRSDSNPNQAILFYTAGSTLRPRAVYLDALTLDYVCRSSRQRVETSVLVLTPNYMAIHLVEGFLRPIVLQRTWCSAVKHNLKNMHLAISALHPQVIYITPNLTKEWTHTLDIDQELKLVVDGGISTPDLARHINATRIYAPSTIGTVLLESKEAHLPLRVVSHVSALTLNDQGLLTVRGYLGEDAWSELRSDRFFQVDKNLGLEWLSRSDHGVVLSSGDVIPSIPIEALVADTLLSDSSTATGIVCLGNGRDTAPYILIEQPAHAGDTLTMQGAIDARLHKAHRAARHLPTSVRDALFLKPGSIQVLSPDQRLPRDEHLTLLRDSCSHLMLSPTYQPRQEQSPSLPIESSANIAASTWLLPEILLGTFFSSPSFTTTKNIVDEGTSDNNFVLYTSEI